MELTARIQLELAEDARKVTLDCPSRDEERLCDLAVLPALARQFGNSELARRQRIDPGENDAARPRPGGAKLRLGFRGESHRAGPVSDVERLAEELFRLRASISPAKHGAEIGESPRSLQPRVRVLER